MYIHITLWLQITTIFEYYNILDDRPSVLSDGISHILPAKAG